MEWLSAYRFYFPNSAGCAAELTRRLGKTAEEIAVTGVALRPVFADLHAGQAAAPDRPTAVAGDYFLFVGGPDWRKNLEGVVEAYGRLPALHDGPALVIAGGYPEAWRRRVVQQAARISGGRARLHFLEHGLELDLLQRQVCLGRLVDFGGVKTRRE
jgi:glycosyltransferase involved in cell wall biosynthesis